tara:strand:- start:81 stop:302 length:222 start_codon:yes stop_codon:yes gene_type:complete
METDENKKIDPNRIKELQESFDTSMKILESHIAESITNKERLDLLKKDLKEANKKFMEAERCMDALKIDIEKV